MRGACNFSLLPAQPPLMPDLDIAALVEPAAEIGGDFVGYFPRGAELGAVARQIGIAVGDISGKGLGAALLLSGTVVALNTVAAASAAPREVARALHDAMYPYTSRSRMTIAFCYSLLAQQPGGWSMRTGSAQGAVAPLLRRASGECVWLETAGFPLGTLAGEEWRELRLDLQPGDVVLLFSDGIIEAMDERREMFGFDRLTGVMCDLPRDTDAHTIISRVGGRRAGAHRRGRGARRHDACSSARAGRLGLENHCHYQRGPAPLGQVAVVARLIFRQHQPARQPILVARRQLAPTARVALLAQPHAHRRGAQQVLDPVGAVAPACQHIQRDAAQRKPDLIVCGRPLTRPVVVR